MAGILYVELIDRCLKAAGDVAPRSVRVIGTVTSCCRFEVACGLRGMQVWRMEEAHHQR